MLGAHYDEGSYWQAKLGLETHPAGGVAPLRGDLARAQHIAEMRARRLGTADSPASLLPAGWFGSLLRNLVALATLQALMPTTRNIRRSSGL